MFEYLVYIDTNDIYRNIGILKLNPSLLGKHLNHHSRIPMFQLNKKKILIYFHAKFRYMISALMSNPLWHPSLQFVGNILI